MNRELAQAFRRLHEQTLVLPNAWDVASARLIERAGARAVATTSAGVAWSTGAADGQRLDRRGALEMVARVAAAVEVPVTADIERGYAGNPSELRETVAGVLAAGAVGVNVEDSSEGRLAGVEEQAEWIALVRSAALQADAPLFINARIDTYLLAVGEEHHRYEQTVERARRFLAAGADGIFVPGVADLRLIHELVAGIPAPVNVMVGPGSPPVAALTGAGVRRVSTGPALALAAYGLARRAAIDLLEHGTYETFEGGVPYGEMNDMFRVAR